MTEVLERPFATRDAEAATIEKVTIVVSKGSLEGIYPALLMADGARRAGIDATLFFTFHGLEAIRRDHAERVRVATVGNPAVHVPTMIGGLPGASALATHALRHRMARLEIPAIPAFVARLAEAGVTLYACRASVDTFGLTEGDLVEHVTAIVGAHELYGLAGGGQIVFT